MPTCRCDDVVCEVLKATRREETQKKVRASDGMRKRANLVTQEGETKQFTRATTRAYTPLEEALHRSYLLDALRLPCGVE